MVLQAGPGPGGQGVCPRGAGCGCRSCSCSRAGSAGKAPVPDSLSLSLQLQCLSRAAVLPLCHPFRDLPPPQGLCLPHTVAMKHSLGLSFNWQQGKEGKIKPFPSQTHPLQNIWFLNQRFHSSNLGSAQLRGRKSGCRLGGRRFLNQSSCQSILAWSLCPEEGEDLLQTADPGSWLPPACSSQHSLGSAAFGFFS